MSEDLKADDVEAVALAITKEIGWGTFSHFNPEDVRRISRAAIAALNTRTNEHWQSIESAPRDGPIMLWPDEYGEITISRLRMNDGTWWLGDWEWQVPATHWCALPTPPQSKGKSNG
jgi:hypothetical protein